MSQISASIPLFKRALIAIADVVIQRLPFRRLVRFGRRLS